MTVPSIPDLPAELVDIVLEHLCAPLIAAKRTVHQLHDLCLVNRRWADCFQPYLYEQVVLQALCGRSVHAFRPKKPWQLTGRLSRWGSISSCSLFLRTLSEHPDRTSWVRHFSAQVPSPLIAPTEDLSGVPVLLSQLTNLVTLHLEDLRSPREPALETIPIGSFPLLEHCYLVGSHKVLRHDTGTEGHYPANVNYICTGDVFPFWCAPRLRRMSLQYFSLCWDGRRKPTGMDLNPVERLDLIACIVNQHFTDDLYAIRSYSAFSLANSRAIAHSKASPVLSLIPKDITELYIDLMQLRLIPEWDGSLAELAQLRTLTVDWVHFLNWSRASQPAAVDGCSPMFPPSMERLNIIVWTGNAVVTDIWVTMRNLLSWHAHLFPSPCTLHFRLIANQQWTRSNPPRVHFLGCDHTRLESGTQLDAAAAGGPGPRLVPTWPDTNDDEVPSDVESLYSGLGDETPGDRVRSVSRNELYSPEFLETLRLLHSRGIGVEVSTKRYQKKGGRNTSQGRVMRWCSTKEKVDLTFYRYSRYWLRQQGFT